MLTPHKLDQARVSEAYSVSRTWEFPAEHSLARKLAMTLARFVARLNPVFWMIFDVLAAVTAVDYAFQLSPRAIKLGLEPSWTQLYIFPMMILLGGHVTGLYERMMVRRRIHVSLALLTATVFAVIMMALVSMLVYYEKTGRWIMLYSGLIYFLLALAPRIAAFYLVQLHRIRILLVGDGELPCAVARRLIAGEPHFELVGTCGDKQTGSAGNHIGAVEDIPRVCYERRVDEIVITNEYLNHPQVLRKCFEATRCGCLLLDQCAFYEDFFEQIPVDHIDESWFFRSKINLNYRFQILVKRGLDVTLSLLGLLLLGTLLPWIWLLIRLTSPGPLFYAQTRCGQFGRPFRMLKFRTMRVDAEPGGAQWAESNDPRVTAAGRLLRRTRLDELPQFWNVLKGDMSLVGPRPERPELVAEIENRVPYFPLRHWARPGLTGLAQIRYRYGASVDDAKEKLQHDLFYIKNWSLILDARILLRTLATLMRGSR